MPNLTGGTSRLPKVGIKCLLIMAVATVWSSSANADVKLDEGGLFKAYGDFRFRYENDWDSIRANGRPRDDRQRLRIRARLGLKFDPNEYIRVETRLRTGATGSQQSPHITIADFSSNSTGRDKRVLFDKWYVRGTYSDVWAWAGRNSWPFWKQNELFWDDDVTPLGVAVGGGLPLGPGKLSATAGFFTLPDGGIRFHGRQFGGQLKYTMPVDQFELTGAAGYYHINGRTGATQLRNGNGARDYRLWVLNFQAKTSVQEIPIKVGLDYMHNAENYSPLDPNAFTARNFDQDDGYVVSLVAGKLKERHDWLAGYYYAHIETLAVHASYAQDDWFRFGSATQTDSSDFYGHEFRLAYAFAPWANAVARLYLVDAITSVQDGKRFRLDFNFKF